LNPPFVVEIGNAEGGTAMFLSDVMASFGVGKVIAIDINDPHFPALGNLRFQRGDSLDQSVLDYVRQVAGQQRGLVLIDGDHSSAQVLAELEEYSDLADYLVVQDTIMQWLDRSWNDNPHVALSHWLPKHPEFMIDDMKMDTTQHPGGWLKRIGGK
jgi:cephalosporin hydroxylase